MKLEATIVTCVVIIHHIVAYLHGGAHNDLAILMAAWQNTFINVVIVFLPLVGVILLWTPYRRIGLYAVAVGMVGAMVFGIVHHYMLESPDHISHLPHGSPHVHATFQWTAGAIAMLEGICSTVAGYFLGHSNRRRDTTGGTQ